MGILLFDKYKFISENKVDKFISLYVSIWNQGCHVYIFVCFILNTGLSRSYLYMFLTVNKVVKFISLYFSSWIQCFIQVYIFVCFIDRESGLSSLYLCMSLSEYRVVKFITLYVSICIQGCQVYNFVCFYLYTGLSSL